MTTLTVNWTDPDTDLGGTGFIPHRAASQTDIQGYLDQHGWRINQRLGHEHCPIDPAHVSNSKNPVVILSGGLYCFSCAGRTGDGFRPFSRLVANAASVTAGLDLTSSARACVPFSHVEYLMRSTMPTLPPRDERCRLAYSALLTYCNQGLPIRQGDLYRRALRPVPFVRGSGCWLHGDNLMPVGGAVSRTALEEYSSCRQLIFDSMGQPTTESAADPLLVEQHALDGIIPGYQEIVPIRGAPLFFVRNRSANASCIRAVPKQELDRVRYIPESARLSEEAVQLILTSVYGGFRVDYTRLLMAAKGVAESGIGANAEILVHGVSSSQKTANIMITASALGDQAFSLTTQKLDNFGEAIGSGSRCASFVYGDEVFKQIPSFADSTLRPILLSLGRDYDYRKLHTGSVKVPFTSVVVLSDTDLPKDLIDDEQFGRRYIYVQLTERVPDWRATQVDWKEFWRHTADHRKAFDTIYSELIDRFFYAGSRVGFHEIARELGFDTFENFHRSTDAGANIEARVLAVFWAVIDPAGQTLPENHNQGRGWRLLPEGDERKQHSIGQALEALAVQACVSPFETTVLMQKRDGRWRELAGALVGARFERRVINGKEYVRFVDGAKRGQKVNEELVTPEKLIERFPRSEGAQ